MDTNYTNPGEGCAQRHDRDPRLVARWRAAKDRFAETVRRIAPGRCEPSAYDHPEIEIARCHAEAARCETNGAPALADIWRNEAWLIESGLSRAALGAKIVASGSRH